MHVIGDSLTPRTAKEVLLEGRLALTPDAPHVPQNVR